MFIAKSHAELMLSVDADQAQAGGMLQSPMGGSHVSPSPRRLSMPSPQQRSGALSPRCTPAQTQALVPALRERPSSGAAPSQLAPAEFTPLDARVLLRPVAAQLPEHAQSPQLAPRQAIHRPLGFDGMMPPAQSSTGQLPAMQAGLSQPDHTLLTHYQTLQQEMLSVGSQLATRGVPLVSPSWEHLLSNAGAA